MKVLLDTVTNKILKYPRADYGEIVGLDPTLKVLDVVYEEMPDLLEGQQAQNKTTIDVDNLKLIHGYEIITTPAQDPMELALERAQKKTAFYLEVLHKINAENDVAGFTSEQVIACMQLLLPIKTLLEAGAVGTALGMLSQIEPIPEYNAERKAEYMQMFQDFLDSL